MEVKFPFTAVTSCTFILAQSLLHSQWKSRRSSFLQGMHKLKCPTGCACMFALAAPGAAIRATDRIHLMYGRVCVCVFVVPWKFKQVQLQQLEWRLDVQPAPCTRYQAPCTTQSGSDRRGKLRYQRRFTVSGNPFRTLCSAFGKSAQWHLLSAKGA